MRHTLIALLCCTTLAACGGRPANPVMVNQYGDSEKSCDALRYELASIEGEMQTLLPKTDKTGQNVALGVTGAFFIVPLFFMDFSQAEQQEYNAYRQRYNSLAIIAMEKGCEKHIEPLPSVEELKKQSEKNQKVDVDPSLAYPSAKHR